MKSFTKILCSISFGLAVLVIWANSIGFFSSDIINETAEGIVFIIINSIFIASAIIMMLYFRRKILLVAFSIIFIIASAVMLIPQSILPGSKMLLCYSLDMLILLVNGYVLATKMIDKEYE